MDKAVFLDRDGVINSNVLYKATGEWEGPHRPEDLQLFPWVLGSLKKLQDLKLGLFLISNQPSAAKGKASLENIKAVQEKLHTLLIEHKIYFTDYFYCYHHPKGIVPELTIKCECRKPGTLFINKAAKEHSFDPHSSWIVGDRDTDIECGQKAGLKTIRLTDVNPAQQGPFITKADHEVNDLRDAVEIISRRL